MKRVLMMSAVCALLAGCDYTVPLVRTAVTPIDTAVVGLWQRTGQDKRVESLLVLPLGTNEYLVAYPAGSKDALFARGCLWSKEGTSLVQLDWIGTAKGGLPENNRTFQYASYTVASNTLSIKLLNPEVAAKDAASSDALVKAITANRDNPDLYRDKMVFRKVQD
jgi:hypothetical protein